MRVVSSLIAGAVIAAGLANGKLLYVNDRNFTDVVLKSGKPTLVDFYADWCRHCSKLMPTIEKVASYYEGDDSIQFVKVNGDKDGKVAAKKYVDIGYPTVKFFFGQKMEPVEFDGSRDAESINNFVQLLLKTRVKNKDIVDPKLYESLVLEVDSTTFDSYVYSDQNSKDSVVLFTEPGSTQDSLFVEDWDKVVKAFANDNVQFLMVNTKGRLSSDLVGQFRDYLNKRDQPTILVFKRSETLANGMITPKLYSGTLKFPFVISFINGALLLHRLPNGRLRNKAGRVLNYEPAIKKLITDVEQLPLDEAYEHFIADLAETSIAGLDSNSLTPYYDRIVKSIVEGKKEYFEKELVRIKTILDNEVDNIDSKSLDSFQERYNILHSIFG